MQVSVNLGYNHRIPCMAIAHGGMPRDRLSLASWGGSRLRRWKLNGTKKEGTGPLTCS